ncbi:helix-turn-helix transcriptional regulator [Geobacter anodireducens]|uniref:AlpA family transcriptional regulator n=1 Tax=Geobacter soli TaxID=1510391 RepID=A0A0C1QPH5_9BACT|nr:AlpA family phage regulatory protein [Geobacter soli]KIE42487.1 hypothetical protein SE37_07500 [Geobacter soli]
MVVSMEEADLQRIAEAVIKALSPRIEALAAKLAVAPETRQVLQPPPSPARSAGDVVRRSELPRMTGLSKTTLWRLERAGEFPARHQLSNGRVGWRRSDVEAWCASRQRA